jgi:hypothetical protein
VNRLYSPAPTGVEGVVSATYTDTLRPAQTPIALSGLTVADGWVTGLLDLTAVTALSSGQVAWTVVGADNYVDEAEVVGGRFLTVEECRRRQPERFTAWSDQQLVHAITEVEVACEDILRYALVPRAARYREYLRGVACNILLPHYPVLAVDSVAVDGVLLEVDDFRSELGSGAVQFYRLWDGDLEVFYSHGLPRPPADLTDHFLTHLRYVLQADQRIAPGQALSQLTADGGRLLLARPGVDGDLGLPDVDAAYCRYAESRTWLGS